MGLYKADSTTASTLVTLIKDVLLRCNFSMCRGQCYNGASVMVGKKNGIFLQDESRAVFTSCYVHSLNLAINDTIKGGKTMKYSLEVALEISKLIKKSPKRDTMLQKLKQSLAPETLGFRVLFQTRWTVCASSLQSIINNYEVLLGVWEESKESSLDSEMRARIIGVQYQMFRFDFLFGVVLGELLLWHSDNLSKSLQHQSMSAAEGQELARLTLKVLKYLRSPENFESLLKELLLIGEHFL